MQVSFLQKRLFRASERTSKGTNCLRASSCYTGIACAGFQGGRCSLQCRWYCSSVPFDLFDYCYTGCHGKCLFVNVYLGSNKELLLPVASCVDQQTVSITFTVGLIISLSLLKLQFIIRRCMQKSSKVCSMSTASTNKMIATHHRFENRAPSPASPHHGPVNKHWSTSLAILLTQNTGRTRPRKAQQRAVQSVGMQHDRWRWARLPSEWVVAGHLWETLANQCLRIVLWPLLKLLLQRLLRLLLQLLLWWSGPGCWSR